MAEQLLLEGNPLQARALLAQLLRVHPHLAEAHWLLGETLCKDGDFTGSERALRMTLHLNPDQAPAHALLGEILARQGHMLEAERALRHALSLESRNATAVVSLVRVMLTLNRVGEARSVIEDFIEELDPPTADLLLLRAQVLLAAADFPEAALAFQQAIEAAPASGAAELGLAVASGQNGQVAAAETAARNAIAKGADNAGSRFVLARALFESSHFDDAEAEFRRVLNFRPNHALALTNLAELIWMRTGDSAIASAGLDVALRADPGLTEPRILKAKLLETAGDIHAGIAVLETGLTGQPDNPRLLLATARMALKCDPARALSHAEKAARSTPQDPHALGTYGDALLFAGHARQAAAAAGKLREINPDDGHAIALQASAWRLLDDERYRALYDYGNFVRADTIDIPDGWQDLSSYLEDLAQSLACLHALQAHPIDQTLRFGTQVEHHLQHSTDPAIRAFAQAIDGPIHRYMQALGHGDDVLRRRNTGGYKLNGTWSVRLRPNGFHSNHFHGKGWLSSACYIQIPDTLGATGGEGWLKFGEPAMSTSPMQPAEYYVRPQPGLLVLFPSWMWHGTVPFAGQPEDSRLTMAFDVVPA